MPGTNRRPITPRLRSTEKQLQVYFIVLLFILMLLGSIGFVGIVLHKDISLSSNTAANRPNLPARPSYIEKRAPNVATAGPSNLSTTIPAAIQPIAIQPVPLDILYYAQDNSTRPPSLSAVLYLSDSNSRNPHVEIKSLPHLKAHLRTNRFSSRNTLIGLAANIDERCLAIFVKSARQASSAAEIILFMNYPLFTSAAKDRDSQMMKILKNGRVHVIEYMAERLEPAFIRSYHPSSQRWIFYHRFFSNHNSFFAHSFDSIIHVDVRDTQFGADPFDYLSRPAPAMTSSRPVESIVRNGRHLTYTKEFRDYDGLCYANATTMDTTLNLQTFSSRKLSPSGCNGQQAGLRLGQKPNVVLAFKEEEGPGIGACTWNAGWVRDCFGQTLLDLIGDSDISCSGVVLGTTPGILEFFSAMALILLGQSTLSTQFPQCERNGVDQGIHNVLLHAGMVTGLSFHSALSFPGVVSHMQSDLYAVADESTPPKIKNAQGAQVAIVHQYDRIDGLQRRFAQYYVDWLDVNDWHANWVLSASGCGKFKRLVQYDLLKGKCDFGSLRSLSPDMCCSQCSKKPGCTGFTFAGGICWYKKCSRNELTQVYYNFTMHMALQLPLAKYIAVADESNTPLTSLVVTAMLQESLDLTNIENGPGVLFALMQEYGVAGRSFRISGAERDTADMAQLFRDYLKYFPLLENEMRQKDESAALR